MIVLAFCITNTCYKSDYDKEAQYPTVNDIGVHLFVTNNGLNKYSAKNIDLALSSMNIPPFNFSFYIVGFNVDLTNSRFLTLEINDINFKVLNQSARLKVENINIELSFDLNIKQASFPYLTDSGSLLIRLVKLGFSSTVSVQFQNITCKQKYDILRENSKIEIQDFSFTFKCSMEMILNSISRILTGFLQEQLNGDLGASIIGVILDSLMKILNNMNQFAGIYHDNHIKSDQRVINGIELVENFFVTFFTGQRMQKDDFNGDLMHGWLNDTIGKQVSFITNNDVQYQIEKIVFNSGFKLYLEEKDISGNIIRRCTTDAVCIESIRLERFHNTGAKVLVTISQNGVNETLTFLEPIIVSVVNVATKNYFTRFGIRLTNLVNGNLLKDKLNSLKTYLDETIGKFDYTIDNFNEGDTSSFITVYLDENWIHVGANF